MATPSSKQYAPNLDAAERQIAMMPSEQAQVVLLHAGLLDVCKLLQQNINEMQQIRKELMRSRREDASGS